MKAVFREHPFHTADGKGKPILVEFLGNNLGREVGVQESIADDLTYDLLGSAVVTFGSGFAAFESIGPMVFKLLQDLVVALSGVAKLLGHLGGAKAFTLAFKEHGELASDFIIFPDGKRSCWAI
ncbi:MAG: hypothetical protein ABSG90_14640 [Dehalococcoidia bacterium]